MSRTVSARVAARLVSRSFPAGVAASCLVAASAACSGSPPPVKVAPLPSASAALATPAPSASVPAFADEAFRITPPLAGSSPAFNPPPIVAHTLPNGVRILLVERHDLPVVAFQIVADRGADQGAPGVGAFVGAMLLSGTKTKSALELSDALGQLGAQFGGGGSLDSIGVSGKVLAGSFPQAFALLADAVRNPAFAKDEVERERSKRLTALAQQKDSPATLLRNAVAEALYPEGHPYRSPLLGVEASLAKLAPADLAKFHLAEVRPKSLTVAIAGDVTKDAAIAEVQKAFGDFQGAPAPARAIEPPKAPKPDAGARVILVDRPGATQSHMAAAIVGVPRTSPDFAAIMVMNTILGGQFSSRLNLNLREKHAYTYGASSGFEMRHGAGPFTAGGAIVREKTGPAAQEIFAELRRIAEAEVSDEELADAKTNLVRRFPASFETVSDVAGALAQLAVYGLPLDEYSRRIDAYRAVTKADVQRVAKAYLALDRVKLVVVGDAAVVEKDLAGLGLGKVEVVRPAPKADGKAGPKADEKAGPKADEKAGPKADEKAGPKADEKAGKPAPPKAKK